MTTFEQPNAESIMGRAKNILLAPDAEWEKIDREKPTIQGLYTGYVGILAAIPPLAGAIGGIVFGYGAMGYTLRPPLGNLIAAAVIEYLLALAAVAVLALVIEQLAPSFDGTRNRMQAFKVAGYSMTAGWLAGIFSIIPALSLIGSVFGFYSFYLLYRGLPKLMKTSQEKALPYTALVVIASILLFFVFNILAAALLRVGMGPGI